MVRFMISLTDRDFSQLRELARREYRDERQMASFLIRESLERRGLLEPEPVHAGQGVNDGN